MPTKADRLIETLRRWPELGDDVLARQADVQPTQQVNQICRHPEASGKLRRTPGPNGKIINTPVDKGSTD